MDEDDFVFDTIVQPAVNGYVISQQKEDGPTILHIANNEQELVRIMGTIYKAPVKEFSKAAGAVPLN